MRMLFLLAATLLLAGAAAQESPLTVTSSAPMVEAGIEAEGTLTLTVTRAELVPAPLGPVLDPLTAGEVTMSVSAPEAWVISITPDAFDLPAGQSQTVTVIVTPSPDAEDVLVTFNAELTTQDPSGQFVPGGSASVDIDLVRSDSATRQLIEAIGPGIWAILGALLVAVIVAIFLAVDSRSRVVDLRGPDGEIRVQAGSTASIPILIGNHGKETDRIELHCNAGDAEWKAAMAITAVTLQPGSDEKLHLAVTPNRKAPIGSRAVVRVIAVPDHAPRRITVLALPMLVVKAE